VVYKKSYHSQLEFATMDSIYQKLLQGGAGTLFLVDDLSDGSSMPAAANFSGTRGFVNNKIGSRGSCII